MKIWHGYNCKICEIPGGAMVTGSGDLRGKIVGCYDCIITQKKAPVDHGPSYTEVSNPVCADVPDHFRAIVRAFQPTKTGGVGYGHMVQIINQEWLTNPIGDVPEESRGVNALCPTCHTLFNVVSYAILVYPKLPKAPEGTPLKPCPWNHPTCEVKVNKQAVGKPQQCYWIECRGGYQSEHIVTSAPFYTEAEAIAAWNDRKS